jgi:choline-sulfatase
VGVPLIFRVPGRPQANARCATPVSHVELAATLLELCGVESPAGLDGGSLVSLLAQPGMARDMAVYSEYGLRTKGAKYMIRRGDFKYCFYVNDMAELYNVREDPREMKNLALLAEYREKAEELKSQLFAWHKPPEMGA